MNFARILLAIAVLGLFGCEEAVKPDGRSPAAHEADADQEGRELKTPASPTGPGDGKADARSSGHRPRDLQFTLEPVGGGGGRLPQGLRLVVRNGSGQPVRFTPPGPFCPTVTEGDRKIRFPLLGAVFHDAEGREGDTNFGPVFADLETRSPPPLEEVSIAPGGSWSREYATASFQFLGPCGPAANVAELFRPGEVELKLALELIEMKPAGEARGESEAEALHPAPPARQRTNAIPVKVAEAPGIFRRYTEEYQARELALLAFLDDESPGLQPPPPSPEEVPEVLKVFEAPDFSAHVMAASLLLRLGPEAKAAVPRLIEILKGSRAYGDRVLAARVLGAIGPPAAGAAPALTEALRDANDHVRQEAAEALAKVQGRPLAEAVDPKTGEPLVWGKSVSSWIEKLGAEDPEDRDREASFRAHQAIVRLGARAVPYLIEALRSQEEKNFHVLMALSAIRDPAARELLAKALKHEDVRVRRGATQALGREEFGGRATAPLSEVAVGALVEALRDSDPEVRRSAVLALGRPEASLAVAALGDVLARDLEKGTRVAAAESLGVAGAGSKEAAAALRAALKDELLSVRHAAAEALRALGEEVPAAPAPAAEHLDRPPAEGAPETKEAAYASVNRAPGEADGVFFVLANGGSNLPQLTDTKAMVVRMIEALPPEAWFGVAFYSARVVKYPEDGRAARVDGKAKAAGIEFVRATEAGSGSCIQKGFEAAFELIEASSAKKIVIVYVGNGFASCPGEDPRVYREESLEVISRQSRGRAAVHTFAGGECDAKFLRLLAEMNGGTFTRLRH